MSHTPDHAREQALATKKPPTDSSLGALTTYYNPVMVKSAYIASRPSQFVDEKLTLKNLKEVDNFQNKLGAYSYKGSTGVDSPQAESAGNPDIITGTGGIETLDPDVMWKDGKAAKGIIKMNRRFADLAPKPPTTSRYTSIQPDKTLYGFRFLYNPTSIDMAWGIVEQFSPQFELTNQDKASAISVGLMKSFISFELLLNRKQDMAALNSSGFISKKHEEMYPKLGRPTVDQAIELYKRGTMLDLDYLFRASGGYGSTYTSNIGKIVTADKGWLQPIPVELHLGQGLRYLVRISELQVSHTQFNERMVPILTTVKVTCSRYYDGPEMFETASNSAISGDKNDIYNIKTAGTP